MVVCLEQSADDLHMVQLMPLLPNLHENPEWFTLLVLAYQGCPGKEAIKGCCCRCQTKDELTRLRREVVRSPKSVKSSLAAQAVLRRVENERDDALASVHSMTVERDTLHERLKVHKHLFLTKFYTSSFDYFFIMVALCNRETIIFSCCFFFFFFFFFFFPRLISAVGDRMFTILWHMVWPQCEFTMQV